MTAAVRPRATILRLSSGEPFDLLLPDWRLIKIETLAEGLARIWRWNGKGTRRISVAEHSVITAQLAPDWARLPALLHDAHEDLTGDSPRPMTEAIEAYCPGVTEAIDHIKLHLDIAICRAVLEWYRADVGHGRDAEARDLALLMRAEPVTKADDAASAIELKMMRSRAAHLRPVGAPQPELADGSSPLADVMISGHEPTMTQAAARFLAELTATTAQKYGACQ